MGLRLSLYDLLQIRPMRADIRKYAQIHANTRKYEQVHAHTCKYAQIHANTSKYTQIHGYTQMLHNRVTSAARERAQRAQRAKRRKDTANSHEQLQGAPFSSVRRHVPASLIIITRFPFTYQTGFRKNVPECFKSRFDTVEI